jgi:hypothetical protein
LAAADQPRPARFVSLLRDLYWHLNRNP